MTIDDSTARLLRTALEEDVGSGDVTTDATVPEGTISNGRIIAKEAGVIAGLDVAGAVFRELDPEAVWEGLVPDGSRVAPGDAVARIRAKTRAILTGERVALNFLQRLSGVATMTARYVAKLEGSSTVLLDTRKTTPGMRMLEKKAVALGGGANHRMGLWDMALIKDNHIVAAGGIGPAVALVRAAHPDLPVEVEVSGEQELVQALDAGVDRVMLDNMTVEEMRRAVDIVRRTAPETEVEISGRVTEDDLPVLAALGADYISVGAITHSAPALDLSFELEASSS